MEKVEQEKKDLSRRDFMKCSLKSAGALALCPSLLSALASCGSDDEEATPSLSGKSVSLDLNDSKFASLKESGATLRLTSSDAANVPSEALIVHRKSASEVLAFTGKCPHAGGKLIAQSAGSTNIVVCDTHAGSFNSSGAGTNSPVSANTLTKYAASVSGDAITISV